jgi:hypothetical protein
MIRLISTSISGIAMLLIFFGCGITSLIFGLPERYIQRDLTSDELIGTWTVTPRSEAAVNEFVRQSPSWGMSAPWKTITLNKDSSCTGKFEITWLKDVNAMPTDFPRPRYSNDFIANNMISCSWNLTKDTNLSGKLSPIVELDFEYPHNYSMRYSLYIYEENEKLILWDFIGDPDDFRPQDFVKTKE